MIDITENLSADLVNIDVKMRSNMFTWRGQFSPQLIEAILSSYADESEFVFDPFLGSGTVLSEAARLGLSASGCEINTAAVAFAKTYELINKPKIKVSQALDKIGELVSKYTFDSPLLPGEPVEKFEEKWRIGSAII